MDLSRRRFFGGLGAALAVAVAPAIIRTPGLIMPIKPALLPQGAMTMVQWGDSIEIVDADVARAEVFQRAMEIMAAQVRETIDRHWSMALNYPRGLSTAVFRANDKSDPLNNRAVFGWKINDQPGVDFGDMPEAGVRDELLREVARRT